MSEKEDWQSAINHFTVVTRLQHNHSHNQTLYIYLGGAIIGQN